MRRFFTDKKLTVGTEIVLDGEEAKHIMTVLRMKPGDELLLINGTGREMTARILNENKGEVRLEAISDAPCPSEPLNRVTLFQLFAQSSSSTLRTSIFNEPISMPISLRILSNSAIEFRTACSTAAFSGTSET